ncbi:MAG: ABC-type nitrate/sulfonate/bicarbonate transport system, permease component [Candidatus Magasanikbacteria bacterium GW2011_GWA2_42_32]|uniref:ABC-type nitrate/sulfonate/bicarbonate transport system, permease component n=1 Tax=Candidatus Magasanikbacteria bacterium GW2011_GWA2_42_32 TaxID=1619039 RepID=A0A0G0ZZW5_9BACT|nr:MAG: ABC-type nitrate/sulfonate/bicarbonate transport system, permease component [Candidatus Magasanikbacteria bacterium GW2011_GWA2_42_32]
MILERKISKIQYISLAVFGLLIFLLVWSLLTYTGFVKSFFLPTPTKVLSSIISLITEGSLLSDIFASFYRILLGFLLSLVISLPLGISLGISRRFEALTEPLIAFIRYIPPSAFIPLAIIWFGIGDLEKVAILFLGVAPYLTLLIADIVISTKRELMEAALTLGASRKDIITKVVIPNSMPGIWDSFRLMIGAAWTFVIIAEIVGASSGLGHLMIESQRFLKTDNIFAAIVIIGILGLATDYFFKITYKIFFPWTEKSHA